ncbi:MAG: hypothetical protein U1F57_11240 [bacterium]
MTVGSITPRTISEEEFSRIDTPIAHMLGTLPEDRMTSLALAHRADRSRLLIEGRREGGTTSYYLSDDSMASSRGSTEATGATTSSGSTGDGAGDGADSLEDGSRMYLNLGGETITQVYYGDYDGDSRNDIILRLSDGGLRVLGTSEDLGSRTSSLETGETTDPYDPEPYDDEVTSHVQQPNTSTGTSPGTTPGAGPGTSGGGSGGGSPGSGGSGGGSTQQQTTTVRALSNSAIEGI